MVGTFYRSNTPGGAAFAELAAAPRRGQRDTRQIVEGEAAAAAEKE
jgi:hypothetical protein